jgi:hypothetical protein
MKMANSDAADYDENLGRGDSFLNCDIYRAQSCHVAVACEVLARRIVHKSPPDKLVSILSTRYEHMHSDGDIELSSALELAIDTHW